MTTTNSALTSQEYITILNILKSKTVVLNCNIILFYCIFDQINATLVSIRDIFQKHEKVIPTPIFLTVVYTVHIVLLFSF